MPGNLKNAGSFLQRCVQSSHHDDLWGACHIVRQLTELFLGYQVEMDMNLPACADYNSFNQFCQNHMVNPFLCNHAFQHSPANTGMQKRESMSMMCSSYAVSLHCGIRDLVSIALMLDNYIEIDYHVDIIVNTRAVIV